MIAAALCVLLTATLPDETVANGYPVLAADVETFYRQRAESGGKLEYPRFATKGELVQGQVGAIVGDGSQIKIVQVIDGKRAMAELTTTYMAPAGYESSFAGGVPAVEAGSPEAYRANIMEPRDHSVTVLLDGFDMSRATDGQHFAPQSQLMVDGTHQYATVAGGTNTIPVVRPTKLPPPPKHPAQLGIGVRTWTDATGTFSVEAAYVGYDKGTVELVKRSGETIKVPIAKLGRDEQALVREQIKAEKANAVTRP